MNTVGIQITQTRHPKIVADRGMDEWTDGRSGPTTRPAFAKATQVKMSETLMRRTKGLHF